MAETKLIFTPADRDAEVKCGSCMACCRGDMVVLGEGDDLADYPAAVTIDWRNPFTGAAQTTVIPQTDSGACVYLGANGCTIYDKRPKMCRVFSCVDFVKRVTDQTTRQQRRHDMHLGLLDRDIWRAGMERREVK